MRIFAVIAFGLLVSQPCGSRSITDENSVVSVYTNQPSTAESRKTSGVYLIASNIAEKITSPFTKLFGFGNNQDANQTSTKRPFRRIEILDDVPEHVSTADTNPLSNEIPEERDVEELSAEGNIKKADKKPEKITLFSSYLPTKEKIELNDTINEVGSGDEEPFGFDDEDDDDNESKPREGGIVYVLEIIGSIIQLIWGGLMALFQSPKTT